MSTKTVTGIYESPTVAESAIQLLKSNGYSDGELSILASQRSLDKNIELKENSKAPEGTSIGATVGGVAGATLAGLAAVGTVTLTGGAGLLAAGPMVAALAGAGTGAATGGVIGGLVGLGMPETEAKFVDEKLGAGNVLIAVTVDESKKNQTKDLLDRTNAEKVTVH